MVVPVIQELRRIDDIDVKVLGLTTARSVLEDQGLPCFSFRDLDADEEALGYGMELLKGGEQSHPCIPYQESIAYLGLSYQCLVRSHGEAGARRLYAEKGRQAFLPVKVMEGVIKEGGYDLVVATNSPRAERAAIIAAGDLGVPSLCLVDLFALQGVEWIGQKGYANKVCVLTQSVKDMLCEAGRLTDEVVVTGNPAFDKLADPNVKVLGKKLRKSKGWEDKKIILWCSQPEPASHPFTGEQGDPQLPFTIEKKLKEICDGHDNWELFVRPHPSENLEVRKYLDEVEYSVEEPLHALLSTVDLVLVMSTTVGLEAVLLGKPVVALNMSIFSADMPFAEMGLARGVDTLEDLEVVMQEALYNHKNVDGLPEVGSSTSHVCRVVCELLDTL